MCGKISHRQSKHNGGPRGWNSELVSFSRRRTACDTGRVAAEKKPKLFESGIDIVLSVIVVVVLMLLFVGPTGMCSVDPENSDLAVNQEVDATDFLQREAQSSNIAIRIPDTPEGWYPNSARRTVLAGEPASVVGWVTTNDGYVQAMQTNAALDDAVESFDEYYRTEEDSEDIAGEKARIFRGDDSQARDIWAVDLGDVRLLVTGSADDDDYRALIEVFAKAAS